MTSDRIIIFDQKDDSGRLTIDVCVTQDGGVKVDYYDVGKAPEAAFGSSTYERSVTIPPDQVAKLATQLLAERFKGDSRTQSKVEAFCKQNGIKTSVWKW